MLFVMYILMMLNVLCGALLDQTGWLACHCWLWQAVVVVVVVFVV